MIPARRVGSRVKHGLGVVGRPRAHVLLAQVPHLRIDGDGLLQATIVNKCMHLHERIDRRGHFIGH